MSKGALLESLGKQDGLGGDEHNVKNGANHLEVGQAEAMRAKIWRRVCLLLKDFARNLLRSIGKGLFIVRLDVERRVS